MNDKAELIGELAAECVMASDGSRNAVFQHYNGDMDIITVTYFPRPHVEQTKVLVCCRATAENLEDAIEKVRAL